VFVIVVVGLGRDGGGESRRGCIVVVVIDVDGGRGGAI
jgi:hypothetical protein